MTLLSRLVLLQFGLQSRDFGLKRRNLHNEVTNDSLEDFFRAHVSTTINLTVPSPNTTFKSPSAVST